MSEHQHTLQHQKDPKDNERKLGMRLAKGVLLATAALNLFHGDTGKSLEAESKPELSVAAGEIADRYTDCHITVFKDTHETPPTDRVPVHNVPRARTVIDFELRYDVKPEAVSRLQEFWKNDAVTWEGGAIRMEVIDEYDMKNPMAHGPVERTEDPSFNHAAEMPPLTETTVRTELYPRTDFKDGTIATFYLSTSADAYLGNKITTTEVDKPCGVAKLVKGEWILEQPASDQPPLVVETSRPFPFKN